MILRHAHTLSRRPVCQVLILALVLVSAGCVRGGPRTLPGAPDRRAILADLDANDKALEGFSAKGTCIIGSPEIVGKRRLRSTFDFQRPDKLHITGHDWWLGRLAFELTSVGDAYVVSLPEEDREFRGDGGEQGLFPMAPARLIQELVFPERWGQIPLRRVRMLESGESNKLVCLEIGLPGRWVRRIKVGGEPWVLRENELVDPRGEVVARATLKDHELIDTVWFPRELLIVFPQHGASLKLDIKELRVNPAFDDGLFSLGQVGQ